MMDQKIYDTYLQILKNELVPAMGCTEPIALAYAAAKAREALGCEPERMEVDCSGNIIKNVKGVKVPNSGGMMGIPAAAVLGVLGGDASKELEVLENITPAHVKRAQELIARDFCKCGLLEGVENLQIIVRCFAGANSSLVEICSKHTYITRIEKNGALFFSQPPLTESASGQPDKDLLNVQDIIAFSEEVKLEDVQALIQRQIDLNYAIAKEGILGEYGANVGRTLLKYYDKADVRVRAKGMAAAGSDARMSGCPMPVVINSGSGNQGIAVSVPVIEYAKHLHSSDETLIRALVVSNLIALLQKRYIGSLSAFCGAVCAAAGAASGIIYLYDGRYEEISRTITNTLANVGGIVCDGAKESCAAKIASAVDAGIMAGVMAGKGKTSFTPGQGLVKESVEKTIQSIGRMGCDGMKATDVEVLKIMLED